MTEKGGLGKVSWNSLDYIIHAEHLLRSARATINDSEMHHKYRHFELERFATELYFLMQDWKTLEGLLYAAHAAGETS